MAEAPYQYSWPAVFYYDLTLQTTQSVKGLGGAINTLMNVWDGTQVVLAAADSSGRLALSAPALAPMKLGTSADLAFTAASAQSAALVGTQIRLVAKGANCRVATGANPTAVATDSLLIAEVEYYFTIVSGDKVAALRDAAADGTLNITIGA